MPLLETLAAENRSIMGMLWIKYINTAPRREVGVYKGVLDAFEEDSRNISNS